MRKRELVRRQCLRVESGHADRTGQRPDRPGDADLLQPDLDHQSALFGEDVENYVDGVLDNTDGTWLAGKDGPPE